MKIRLSIKPKKWRIKRLLGTPRRVARRKGFGIHSPFAFDFVRRVIAQPCQYYCYPHLNAEAQKHHVAPRHMRLLFRIALHFRPASFAIIGTQSAPWTTAILSGIPNAKEATNPYLLVVTSHTDATEAIRCASNGGVVIIINHSRNHNTAIELWQNTSHGIMFCGSDIAIFVGLQHLPHQKFNVWM